MLSSLVQEHAVDMLSVLLSATGGVAAASATTLMVTGPTYNYPMRAFITCGLHMSLSNVQSKFGSHM
jgi:hypothetical protein